jgi:hypothetical protein
MTDEKFDKYIGKTRDKPLRRTIQDKKSKTLKNVESGKNKGRFKKIYTSKARDKKGRRWVKLEHTGLPPEKTRVQLEMVVRFYLGANSYKDVYGCSSVWSGAKVNYRYMRDEAFASALYNSHLSYNDLYDNRILWDRFIKWEREGRQR